MKGRWARWCPAVGAGHRAPERAGREKAEAGYGALHRSCTRHILEAAGGEPPASQGGCLTGPCGGWSARLAPGAFAGAHSSLESLPSSPDSPAEALDWLSSGLRALGLRNEECVELRLCICVRNLGSVLRFAPALSACHFTVLRPSKCSLGAARWFCTGFSPLFMCWPLLSMAASAAEQRRCYPEVGI